MPAECTQNKEIGKEGTEMPTTERKPTLNELIADAQRKVDEQEKQSPPNKPDERGPLEK